MLQIPGDVDRGRDLFFAETQCQSCHSVAGRGRKIGPDLSHAGSKFTRPQLLDHIIEPSKTIDPEWVMHEFETNDDELISGFILSRTPKTLQIRLADGSVTKLNTTQLNTERRGKLSLMPEGLLQAWTA